MRASTKNLWTGRYHEAKGTVKAAMGSAVNSRRLAINGQFERVGGIVQSNFGRFEKVFGW
jgi:uncharacterized protein YjbJ (UPF0337 family)